MDELIAFFRRCLDDDERNNQGYLNEVLETRLEHDARFRLAEVEAKRRILAEYERDDPMRPPAYWDGLTSAIVDLAQPYAGREGWREEWRVDP
jgi:hypothetical protein